MTTRQLRNRWLRTKRHLRSISQNPRALRDAARAVHAAAVAEQDVAPWGSLCRSTHAAAA